MLLSTLPAAAQTDGERINHAGKDFWMTLQQTASGNRCVFYITGASDANVSFEYTSTGALQNYFLQAGTVLPIVLTPAEVIALGGPVQSIETINNTSLHISSDKDIVVEFVNVAGANDDGIMLYPSDNQSFGQEFYLSGPIVQVVPVPNNPSHGAFSIVSRCDSAVLEIIPSRDTKDHAAGIPFNITLNKGNSYIIGCGANTGDLCGTIVRILYSTCCNPINIFLTYDGTYARWPLTGFPPNLPPTCCADQMIEQILPVNVWDTLYTVVNFANNPYSIIKIVSASVNNTVYFDGTPVQILADGQGYDTIIDQPVVITSTRPISITQQMISQSECSLPGLPAGVPVDSMSDPACLWLLPFRDGLHEAYIKPVVNIPSLTVSIPVLTAYIMHAITVISKTSNVGNILLNNVNIGSQFLPFPNNPDYMYAFIKLDTNISNYHLISQERVTAYYYAAYDMGSSAYPMGDIYASNFVVSPILSYTPDTFRMCVNDTATLIADPADEYLWSDGSTGDRINVTDSGLYYVHMRYSDSCGKGGTKLFWGAVKDYETNAISDTVYKCLREVITLHADPTADSYIWSDGTSGQQIEVSALGYAYSVLEQFQPQCRQTEHNFIVLPQLQGALKFDLGPDPTICLGDQFTLTGAGRDTRWSDGSIGDSLIVTQPGTYWAWATDPCMETIVRDTITVNDTICMKSFCSLIFPSAFSPNNDGRNDLFRPVIYGEFTGYYLSVYNRWGEKVYESYKKETGWDGMYKGELAELGVYYYLCNYECTLKGNLMTKGEITLVR